MNDYIEDVENIHNKLVELEDRSRRNNIDGLTEQRITIKKAGENVKGGSIQY